ncbi:hypothetical protein BgAZ_304210 [Babesia gibsoni]|uniref:SUN domain-containing protein n=1 Tax=Babesia gibsoni TaxID=33632 RepID=A0AAD8LK34_BABGI|nr:hypothetical protein BgAZ_304210 [Babesia gibsoni]
MTYMPFAKRNFHLYLLKGLIFTVTFYLCLLHISRSPKNSVTDVVDSDLALSRQELKRLKGKPFDVQAFKLNVDFSSEEEGAKIVAQSKSLLHVKSIQNNDRNSYLLAPCQKTDWFILSLPESIFVKHIAFISYEYYASTYKTIRISASSFYPTDKWNTLAEVETERGQSEIFDISSACDGDGNLDCWAKYIKVELLDFHNFEENYYCSLTSMKVYGSTAVDVLESEISGDNNSFVKDASTLGKVNSELEYITPATDRGMNNITILPKPPDINVDGKYIYNAVKSGEFSSAAINGSSSVAYTDKLYQKTLLQFMTKLASKSYEKGIHRNKYYQLLRFLKKNQCKERSLISVMNANDHIWDHVPISNKHCWRMVLRVKLPECHTWFERLLYYMIKKGFIYSRYNSTHEYFVNHPLLVCERRYGFLGKYSCYSNFYQTSFVTLKSNRKQEGFMPIVHPVLPYRSFYFFFIDGVSRKAVPTSTKVISDAFIVHQFVSGKRLILSDDYVEILEISNRSCTLLMKSALSKNSNRKNILIDMLLKSYANKAKGNNLQVTKDLKFIKFLLSYGVDDVNMFQHDETFPVRTNKRGRAPTGTASHNTEKPFVNVYGTLPRREELANPFKRTQGHKHVLLQLSERVKSLEIFSGQLKMKSQQMNEALDSCLDHLHRFKEINVMPASILRMSKWGDAVQDYTDLVFKSWNMRKIRIIFLHRVPQPFISNHNCIETPISHRFSSCVFFLKGGKGFANGIQKNTCPINKVHLGQVKSGCNSLVMLIHLSIYMRTLKAWKMIDCCRRFGCHCTNCSFYEAPILIWTPHFSNFASNVWSFSFKGKISYFVKICSQYVLGPSFLALRAFMLSVFNIYTISLCFFISQVFWFYRDRANRALIYDIYEKTHRCQRSKTF